MRVVSMAVLVALCAGPAPVGGQEPDDPTFRVADLGPGVWAAVVVPRPPSYAFANSLVVEGEDAVLVVDTQQSPTAARALIARIEARTGRPVRWVVNTHWHADHVAGNSAYTEAFPGVEILGHESLVADVGTQGEAWRLEQIEGLPASIEDRRRWLDEGVGPDGTPLSEEDAASVRYSLRLREAYLEELGTLSLIPPTRTFERALELDLGGRTVRLLHVGPAHTRGDVVVHVPDAGVLAVGDLLEQGLPWLEGADVAGWAEALDTIAALDAAVHVPAHGPPVRDGALLRDYRAFFQGVVVRGRLVACGEEGDAGRLVDEIAPAFETGYGVPPERLAEAVETAIARASAELGCEGGGR